MEQKRTVTSIVDTEALEYAMYTIENRALPSLVDSFKPVQRYVLAMALKIAKNDFNKVAAIGGSISSLGYTHGEEAAQNACKLLASDWNNNVPLLQGRGNFGSRLVNDSAAARYVYAKIHENFNKIYGDFDILPDNPDPEKSIPLWYVPSIPTVLLNGITGIATGFATKIMPYSLNDVTKTCAQYLAGRPLTQLVPTFPKFTGEVTRIDKVITLKGIYELNGYTLKITEVPVARVPLDRERYVMLLDSLEENGKIVSYVDECNKDGFNFTVKLKRNLKWTDSSVVKMFKLSSSFTEDITVLDEFGKLKFFDSPEELVIYFVNFKLKFLEKRIANAIKSAAKSIELATHRVHWINENIEGNVNYSKMTKKDLEKNLSSTYGEQYVSNLISMNLYHMSTDEIKKLEGELAKLKTTLEFWNNQTPKMQFVSDLK